MSFRSRVVFVAGYAFLFMLALGGTALADPLEDAGAQLGSFLLRAGMIMTGLIPGAAALAVGGLAVKRAAAKAMGEEDGMTRAGNQIVEVLKLAAVGTSSAVLVGIAGSILK